MKKIHNIEGVEALTLLFHWSAFRKHLYYKYALKQIFNSFAKLKSLSVKPFAS
jgi:hypothetical protein